jgi:hypothetical protein
MAGRRFGCVLSMRLLMLDLLLLLLPLRSIDLWATDP